MRRPWLRRLPGCRRSPTRAAREVDPSPVSGDLEIMVLHVSECLGSNGEDPSRPRRLDSRPPAMPEVGTVGGPNPVALREPKPRDSRRRLTARLASGPTTTNSRWRSSLRMGAPSVPFSLRLAGSDRAFLVQRTVGESECGHFSRIPGGSALGVLGQDDYT